MFKIWNSDPYFRIPVKKWAPTSVHIIHATDFGIALFGHLAKLEIILSIVKNLHFISTSSSW
jgi:hypothetical protein